MKLTDADNVEMNRLRGIGDYRFSNQALADYLEPRIVAETLEKALREPSPQEYGLLYLGRSTCSQDLDSFLANRRAEFAPPKDAAVEAAMSFIRHCWHDDAEVSAAKIVAAVDRARADRGRAK